MVHINLCFVIFPMFLLCAHQEWSGCSCCWEKSRPRPAHQRAPPASESSRKQQSPWLVWAETLMLPKQPSSWKVSRPLIAVIEVINWTLGTSTQNLDTKRSIVLQWVHKSGRRKSEDNTVSYWNKRLKFDIILYKDIKIIITMKTLNTVFPH